MSSILVTGGAGYIGSHACKVLAAAGATFDDIVDVTSFHTDMRDLPLYMQVRDRYFTGNYPAWTAIGAASLCGAPGYFLEVKAVAVLRD